MIIKNKKLFKALLYRAHEPTSMFPEMEVVILANNLYSAKKLLQTSIHGWKKHMPIELNEIDNKLFYDLTIPKQNLLLQKGYLYVESI